MNRSNMVKVVAAFVAGVLVTVGSLIYSRSQELDQFRKVVLASRPLKAGTPAVSATSSSATTNADLQKGNPLEEQSQKIEPTSEKTRPIHVPKRVVRTQVRQADAATQQRSEIEQNIPGFNITTSLASVINNGAQDALRRPISVPKPNMVAVPAGTNLTIRLEESVSTDRNRTGDRFLGTVDSPVIVNDFVLADKGATVSGQITKVKRARLLGGKSDLSLILTEITLTDGQRARIETSPWEGKSAHNSIVDTPKIAAGAALGAVVGALTGAAKGAGLVSGNDAGTGTGMNSPANKRNLVLTRGARLTFQLARPVTITERLNYR